MKQNDTEMGRLIAELESDRIDFKELVGKWEMISTKISRIEPDEFDWAALGYTIHNIYNLVENYFLPIAKFFENNLDPAEWHKSLVGHMALEIDRVRPSFLQKKDLSLFDDLRGFRHVFRNIYQSRLDEERLRLVSSKIPLAASIFKERHDVFIGKLHIIRDQLSER